MNVLEPRPARVTITNVQRGEVETRLLLLAQIDGIKQPVISW